MQYSRFAVRFEGYHPYSYPLTREHKNISYTRNIIYVWENENMRTDSNTKRYHKTQALMGATRLASGKMQCLYTKQRLTGITNYTQVCEPLL